MDDLDFEDVPLYPEVPSSFGKAYIEPLVIWILTNPSEFFIMLGIIMGPLMIATIIASYKLLKTIEKDEKRKKEQIGRRQAINAIRAKKPKPHKTD